MRITRSLYLAPLLAGCYTYTAITPASAPAGVEVRARITGAASDRIAPVIQAFDTRELIGNVVENRNGALLLDVPFGTRPNVAAATGPLHTQISLAPADMVSLEQRRLDVTRTTLLTGAILGGIGVGVAAALHSGGGGEAGKGPPEPPGINRIPIWRLHF